MAAHATLSTTKKGDEFSRSPLKDNGEWKPVTAIAGIGKEHKKSLCAIGMTKAYHVIGQYLVNNMDEEIFKQWLYDLGITNVRHIQYCYECVSDWVTLNM